MTTIAVKLAAIPEEVLSAPGRALLNEIMTLNTDWAVDVLTINGHWFLVEKNQIQESDLTPIEVFNLEENTLF